jgi:ATP-dependent proteinase. Serine peptidase. MEROPS family S16
MKESARASLSFVQSRSEKLGLSKEYFSKHEIHIHVPSGAIPKDGPSAGITMASAIASLVTGIPVPATIAMTGEIALSGRVLPVGGIKEKLIGAREAGIQEVFIPVDNEKDLEEIPEEVRKDLTIHVVHHMDELLDRLFLSHEKPRKGGGNGFRPNAKKAGHKTAGIRG